MGQNLIKEMTASCRREDCKIESKRTGMSAGMATSWFWQCRSCGREWSVTTYGRGPTTYDKSGNPTHAPERPQEVREITRDLQQTGQK